MRLAVIAIVTLVVAIPAAAVGGGVADDWLGAAGPRDVKAPVPHPAGVPDGRVGGETIADATPITQLPFSDTASTTGRVNDYEWVCPYTGSTSPDVVYSLVVGADVTVTIDLCDSSYDTKLYVVQDDWPNVLHCNDDAGCGYSGYQSRLEAITLTGGHAYYIVVDGYGDSSGTYVLSVAEDEPCVLECPPGAILDPDCGGMDHYNGGCNSDPPVWQDIPPPAPGATTTIFGMSSTFLMNGFSYRDTDWYRLTVTQTQTVTYCCWAEFPLLIFFIDGGTQNCMDYSILGHITGGRCEKICLTYTVTPGVYWCWAGPSVYSGVPHCANYIATIDGYEAPSPAESASWATIKALYR